MKRRTVIRTGLSIAGGLTFGAGFGPGIGSAAGPTKGGSVVAVASQPPQHLVPALSPAIAIFLPGSKIHETLVSLTFGGTFTPVLATSWDHSPDGKTFTFHLRQGVKWHDGRDFTADDVAYSIELWKVRNPFARGVLESIATVDTPDPHTVVMRASAPVPLEPLMLLLSSYGSVVPKHIYAGTDVMKNPAIIAPIGTGPFVFKEWVKGEYVSLSRNPNYWDPSKPYLDSFIVRYVTDASSRAAMLESGEATYAGNNMVALEDMGRFAKMPNVVLDSKGSDGFQGTHIMEVNLRNPILAKVEVRQAISYAIDRDFIAKNVYAGFATPAWGPIPSKNAFYNPGVAKYPYDPKRANQMLDHAGFPRVDGGSRFKLYLDPSNIFAEFGQSAAYIKQALAQVGIDVTIRNFDELVRLGRVYNDYDFDLTVYNLPLVLDPQISIYPYYSTKTIAKGRTNTNAYDYRSERWIGPSTPRISRSIRAGVRR